MSTARAQGVLPKRRRTAIACVSCRMRKSRCDGGWPVCAMCRELGVGCVYVQPKKNVIPAASGTSGTTQEERLAVIESKLDKLLAVGLNHSDASGDFNSPLDTNNNDCTTIVAEAEDDSDRDIDEADDGGLDGLASISDSPTQETTFFGPTSSIAFLQILSTASLALFRHPSSQNEHQDHHQPLAGQIPQSASSSGRKSRGWLPNPLALPAHSEVMELLDAYFGKTSFIFPFVSRSEVTSTYQTCRSKGFRRSYLALLNAIFALTIHENIQFTLADAPLNEAGLTRAETFYCRAESLLSKIDSKTHNVETVQCLLLLAQYSQATPKSARIWPLFCNALTAATQLGLHSSTPMPGLSPFQQEVRLRTWWQCIAMDRLLSMTFGRPPLIPEAHIVVPLPSSENIDEMRPGLGGVRGQPTMDSRIGPNVFYVEAMKLYSILGRLTDTVYGNNLAQTTDQPLSKIVSKILAIEVQLQAWYRELPQQLRYDKPSPVSVAPAAAVGKTESEKSLTQTNNLDVATSARLASILQLRYLNIRNLTYRGILCSYLQNLEKESHQLSKDQARLIPEAPDDTTFSTFLFYQSLTTIKECASDIIDMIEKSAHEPSALGARWYATYYVFHACLALYGVILVLVGYRANLLYKLPALAADPDDVANIAKKLRRGLDALAEIGKGTTPETRTRQHALVSRMVDMTAKLIQRYGGQADGDLQTSLLRPGEENWVHGANSGAPIVQSVPEKPYEIEGNNGTFDPAIDTGYFDAQVFQLFLQSTVDLSTDFSFWGPPGGSLD